MAWQGWLNEPCQDFIMGRIDDNGCCALCGSRGNEPSPVLTILQSVSFQK